MASGDRVKETAVRGDDTASSAVGTSGLLHLSEEVHGLGAKVRPRKLNVVRHSEQNFELTPPVPRTTMQTYGNVSLLRKSDVLK